MACHCCMGVLWECAPSSPSQRKLWTRIIDSKVRTSRPLYLAAPLPQHPVSAVGPGPDAERGEVRNADILSVVELEVRDSYSWGRLHTPILLACFTKCFLPTGAAGRAASAACTIVDACLCCRHWRLAAATKPVLFVPLIPEISWVNVFRIPRRVLQEAWNVFVAAPEPGDQALYESDDDASDDDADAASHVAQTDNALLAVVALHCPNLRQLYISGKVSPFLLEHLGQHLKSLETITFNYVLCDRPQLSNALWPASAERLRTIVLGYYFGSDAVIAAIGAHCPNLVEFRSEACHQITSDGVAQLVRGCPKIERLELSRSTPK